MFDVTSSSTSNDAPNLDFNFDSVKTEQFKTESVNYNAQFQAPMCSFEMNNINHQDFQFQDAFIPQAAPINEFQNPQNMMGFPKRKMDHQFTQSLPKKFKKHKIKLIKKPKPIKYPVYREGIQPAQILNEFNPNLKFEFDVDRSYLNRAKYTCTVQIKVTKNINSTAQDADLITIGQIASESQGDIFTFVGDGFSKKDAKKKCCHFALMGIYGDTYKPPLDIINYYLQPSEIKNTNVKNNAEDENQKRLNEIKKRINKLFNSDTVKRKSPSQLLHELCTKISETGKCVSENGTTAEQKFCFQFNNIAEESIVPIDEQNPMSIVALGYGKSKKDAKSHGAKAALRNFFNIDLDTSMS